MYYLVVVVVVVVVEVVEVVVEVVEVVVVVVEVVDEVVVVVVALACGKQLTSLRRPLFGAACAPPRASVLTYTCVCMYVCM